MGRERAVGCSVLIDSPKHHDFYCILAGSSAARLELPAGCSNIEPHGVLVSIHKPLALGRTIGFGSIVVDGQQTLSRYHKGIRTPCAVSIDTLVGKEERLLGIMRCVRCVGRSTVHLVLLRRWAVDGIVHDGKNGRTDGRMDGPTTVDG